MVGQPSLLSSQLAFLTIDLLKGDGMLSFRGSEKTHRPLFRVHTTRVAMDYTKKCEAKL
jgi:hypothetical protein